MEVAELGFASLSERNNSECSDAHPEAVAIAGGRWSTQHTVGELAVSTVEKSPFSSTAVMFPPHPDPFVWIEALVNTLCQRRMTSSVSLRLFVDLDVLFTEGLHVQFGSCDLVVIKGMWFSDIAMGTIE